LFFVSFALFVVKFSGKGDRGPQTLWNSATSSAPNHSSQYLPGSLLRQAPLLRSITEKIGQIQRGVVEGRDAGLAGFGDRRDHPVVVAIELMRDQGAILGPDQPV